MQEMLGMEKNKRILIIVIISSIVIVILGLYMFLFNNPKQVLLTMVDKINDKGLAFLSENLSTLNLYNKDFVSNIDLDYYIERDAIKEEKSVAVNPETGEEVININKVPYTQILSNKFNAYINRSSKNSHDIIKLTLPINEEENELYNVYYQNGTIILDASQFDQFVKLNNDVLKFGNAKPDIINKMIIIYQSVYKQIIKQFRASDFYRISIEEDFGDGMEKAHRYGISINDERFKQILINALRSLSKDQEFIKTYIEYKKQIDINSAIDKTAVRDLINSWIEKIKVEENNNKIYEAVITTTGIFNQDIKRIEIFELENSNVLKSASIYISGMTAIVQIQDDVNTIYSMKITRTENGYSTNIQKDKYDININYNDFIVSKEIVITGTVDNKKISGKYLMKKSAGDSQLNNEMYFTINNGEKNIVYINMKNKTEFKTITEYVDTKRIYAIEQLDIQVKEYVDKFINQVVEKLGIKLENSL